MPRCTAPSPATIPAFSPISIIMGSPGRVLRQRGNDIGADMRQIDDRTIVTGQIAPHEVAALAQQGVTVIVNNRPDGEEAGQPFASDIEEAAAQAGITYH